MPESIPLSREEEAQLGVAPAAALSWPRRNSGALSAAFSSTPPGCSGQSIAYPGTLHLLIA